MSGKAMSNKAVSSKSVSNKAVSSMDKRSSMGNSMVGNRVCHCVVGNGVGNCVDERGGVGNSVVGNWVSHVGSHWNNSGMSNGDGPVGSDGRLDLREALGVVSLSDRGMGGAKGLGLDKGPLLAVGSGN